LIYCEKTNLVFVHIARTAGTSIERSLSAHLQIPFEWTFDNPIFRGALRKVKPPFAAWSQHRDINGVYNCKHATARQIRAVIGRERWRRAETFSVVRDPADRLVSIFSFFRYAPGYEAHPIRKFGEFRGFLDAVLGGEFAAPDVGRQWHSLTDADGTVMVKRLIPYDHLREKPESLLRTLGIPYCTIARENSFPRPSIKNAYLGDESDRVRALYPLDTLIYRRDATQ